MDLMIAYEMNPSSGPVIVQGVLDIRHAEYNEAGNIKSGYKLPDELKGRHFVRQIGLVTKGDKVYACVQPPGTYTPDFGYGPITGRITTRKERVELKGRYDKFPGLPRYKEIFVREITQDGMPAVEQATFDVLNSHMQAGPLTEEDMDKLIKDPEFCRALKAVFKTVEFETGFAAPDKERRTRLEHTTEDADNSAPAVIEGGKARDYSRPQNGYHPIETRT